MTQRFTDLFQLLVMHNLQIVTADDVCNRVGVKGVKIIMYANVYRVGIDKRYR